MKIKKAIVAFVMAVTVLATNTVTANAAGTSGSTYVTWKKTASSAVLYAKADTTIYKGCSTNTSISPVKGVIPKGSFVNITGYCDTGSELWYAVSYNGITGYTLRTNLDAALDYNIYYNMLLQVSGGNITIFTEDQMVSYLAGVLAGPQYSAKQKAQNVHDYLCMVMSFDTTYTHYSTYDALFYKTGVCQSYANAFQRIMEAAGVTTDFLGGVAYNGTSLETHAWNRCLVDGVYYYVDCTWDDEGKYAGQKYFWTTDATFGNTHYATDVNEDRIK